MRSCAENIKISFKINNVINLEQFNNPQKITKITNSFFVIRDTYVYIIFFNGHVNVTKLKNYRDLLNSQFRFCSFANVSLDQIKWVRIDNIVASGRLVRKFLNKRKFINFLQYLLYQGGSVHYNPEKFPGARIKLDSDIYILFLSGKFNIVGQKSFLNLNIAREKFNNLYNEHIGMFSS